MREMGAEATTQAPVLPLRIFGPSQNDENRINLMLACQVHT